jgi:DNA-binding NarL/FixJ family response regulator
VLQYVAAGWGTAAIAEQLAQDESAVKARIARIGSELGAGERAAMVLLALRPGVIC